MIRRTLLALVLAASVAGCGRVKPLTPNYFTLDATRDCLGDADVRTDERDLGFIAPQASGGAFHAWMESGNSVVLMFGQDDKEAASIVHAFGEVAKTPEERKRQRSLIEPRGNAVIDWISEPRPAERRLVRDCLK